MFINLEDSEVSGKTSHIPHLVEFLREKGYTVLPTREPDRMSISEQSRVRAGYQEMVKAEPIRWVVVNSEQAWDSVQVELRKVILRKLGK